MKRSKKRGNFIEISLWMIKKRIKTIQTTEILSQDIMDKQPLNIFPTLTHVLLLPSSREYVNFALNDFSQITSHVFMSLHEFLEPLVLLLTCCTLSLRIHNIKESLQDIGYTTSSVHNKLNEMQTIGLIIYMVCNILTGECKTVLLIYFKAIINPLLSPLDLFAYFIFLCLT